MEIKRMCNMKCVFVPVIIIGATGMVEKGLKKIWNPYLVNIQ